MNADREAAGAEWGTIDGVLLLSVVLLCLFGVIMVYSSSAILARAAEPVRHRLPALAGREAGRAGSA